MLPISGRKNTWGQELEYFFDRLAVGKKPPNFIQPDTSGNEIILTNFVGKYVLLDFWASWCRPCREATPELVKIYDEFKYKNFEIISVAIDENNDKWIKALSDDNMTWINVSDLKSWKNAVAVAYNITSIPFNLLLDDKGIIIEKNIWGEELHETLQKRLK